MRRAAGRLLIGPALIAAAVPARALDRPQPCPELPHLGSCGGSASGFLLPGTDACLTIGGFVRAEGAWVVTTPRFALATPTGAAAHPTPSLHRLDGPALGTSARLTADMRVPTELGPLRVFVSLRGHNGAATDRAAR